MLRNSKAFQQLSLSFNFMLNYFFVKFFAVGLGAHMKSTPLFHSSSKPFRKNEQKVKISRPKYNSLMDKADLIQCGFFLGACRQYLKKTLD
jgi:hypothetical protein